MVSCTYQSIKYEQWLLGVGNIGFNGVFTEPVLYEHLRFYSQCRTNL